MSDYDHTTPSDDRSANSDTVTDTSHHTTTDCTHSFAPPKQTSPSTYADSVRELQFYWQLAGAKDVPEFMNRILAVLGKFGYSDFAFGRVSARAGTAGNLATSLDEVLKLYQAEEFYLHDMILQHCEVSNKPIFMSTLEEYLNHAPFNTMQIERNLELIKFCKSNGYNDYYSIPFQSHRGEGNVMLAVSSAGMSQADFRRKTADARPTLHLLADAIDYIGVTKFADFFATRGNGRNIIITPKPLRLLNALAKNNITLKEAASKLCISLDTAHKHITAAKSALGANTQAAAVYLAIKEGLITCEDDEEEAQ